MTSRFRASSHFRIRDGWRSARGVPLIHARTLAVVWGARHGRATRVRIWAPVLLVLFCFLFWQGEARADDASAWPPRRTVIRLRSAPEPDDNWMEIDPPRETPQSPQQTEAPAQEAPQPSPEVEQPAQQIGQLPWEVEGPLPGYHAERKFNYLNDTLIVGGALVAAAGAGLLVTAGIEGLAEDEKNDEDEQVETSRSTQTKFDVGLGVGALGAALIVIGVLSADKVYVRDSVARVSFVPVVGLDRAGGALTGSF